MKQIKKLWRILTGIVLACAFVLPISNVDLHAAEYEVVFKAGAHGTVNGDKEVSYRLSSNDLFPNEPDVQVEAGYVFVGWNKSLPSVGSNVTGKMVYVAKYAVVIDGVTYTIRYVDENKVDIATPRTLLGEKGSQATARAKNVAGYTYQQAEQTFTIKDGLEIQFVYKLTNPDEVVRYESTNENTTTNQTTSQNNQNTIGNQNNQNNQNNPNTEETTEENLANQEQPKTNGEENISDNNTPKSKGLSGGNMMIAAVGGFAALLGIIVFIILKKRKNEKEA